MLASSVPTKDVEMKVEYVSELDEKMLSGRHQVEFGHIFEKFKSDLKGAGGKDGDNDSDNDPENPDKKAQEESKDKLSRKKVKELNRMKVSELKQVVKRPDVVEAWDVTSKDPLFLVWLK